MPKLLSNADKAPVMHSDGTAWLAVHSADNLQRYMEAIALIEHRSYTHPWSRKSFVDSVEAGHRIVLWFESNVLVGYYVAMQCVDEMHLLNITVRPESRGSGLGLRLMRHLLRSAADKACVGVLLEVRASNAPALHLYEKLGFLRIGERRNYYPLRATEREDAVVMHLPMAPYVADVDC